MKEISLCLALTCLLGCSDRSTLKTGLEGMLLPKFNMLLIDSNTNFSTSDIPRGKSSDFFYFSPHCPYCRAQLNEIIANMDYLKGIQFYLITNYPASETKSFYNEYKLFKYPNITVAYDFQYNFTSYFKTPGVPYMAIYGKDQRLKGVYLGQAKGKEIERVANE